MRWVKMCRLALCLSGMTFLIATFQFLWAGEIVLRSLQIKKPIAILLEINGDGNLKRNGKTYTINAPGAGFRKGDIFSVPVSGTGDHYAVIALNKAVKEEDTSYVRLEEGAKIVFLDDDGKVAITGVYVESTTSSAPSSLVFYINHASPDSPFFVWTPDLVVGVRGTYFEVRPADIGLHYKTEVIGYNAVDGSERARLVSPTPGQFKPYDLKLILANAEMIVNFLKTNLSGGTIPNLIRGGNISVSALSSSSTEDVIAAYYYMSEHYASQLKEILNDVGNPLNLGVDITKISSSVSITYNPPVYYFNGFINRIFSNMLVSKPVVVDTNVSLIPPQLTLSVTYLITENPSCVSSGGVCTYEKYKIGLTTTLYDVLVYNQNIIYSAFKDLVIGLVNAYSSFFSSYFSSSLYLLPPPLSALLSSVFSSSIISIVPYAGDEINIFGCTYKLGGCSSGTCNILDLMSCSGPGSAVLSWISSTFSDVLRAIKVEYFMAVDIHSTQSYLCLNENSDTVGLTEPGIALSMKIEEDSFGAQFIYPVVGVKKAGPVPIERRVGTLKNTSKNFKDKKRKRHSGVLEKADEEDDLDDIDDD